MKIEHRVRQHALEYWRMLKKDEPMVRRNYLESRYTIKKTIFVRKKMREHSWWFRAFCHTITFIKFFDLKMFLHGLMTRKSTLQHIIRIYKKDKFLYHRLNQDLNMLEDKYGF